MPPHYIGVEEEEGSFRAVMYTDNHHAKPGKMVTFTLGSDEKWQEPEYLELKHPTNEATKLLNFMKIKNGIYLVCMHKIFIFVKEDGTVTS